MSACLAGGRAAALSHLAAAGLWGAEQVKAGRLEITTFDNRQHQLPDIRTHRSKLDPTLAITHHRNLPIVVPSLTVVQLAETCHPHLVKSVANDLVKRHWTSFPQILSWVETLGDRRRPALRELCLRAIDVGGHDDSPPARTLCLKLERAGAEPFELDYQVNTPGGLVLVDIAWPRHRYGIEYNGARDHESPLAQGDDARRRACLAAAGWLVIDANRHITYEEVVQLVLAALANPHNGAPKT
jgi:very-short-patch-repair endonuclease